MVKYVLFIDKNGPVKKSWILNILLTSIGMNFFFINSSYEALIYQRYNSTNEIIDINYATVISNIYYKLYNLIYFYIYRLLQLYTLRHCYCMDNYH